MKRRDLATLGGALAVLALIALGIYTAFFAPCDWLDWVKASEVPARCLR